MEAPHVELLPEIPLPQLMKRYRRLVLNRLEKRWGNELKLDCDQFGELVLGCFPEMYHGDNWKLSRERLPQS